MTKISLTQFLNYTAKVSTESKINYVRTIKSDPEYSPGKDYWKPLRDRLHKILQNGDDINNLKDLLVSTPEKKLANYTKAVNQLIRFFSSHEIEYFDTGSAIISSPDDQISVSAGPELGVKIDGQPYLLKIYYRKKDNTTKVTLKNIQSTLVAVHISKKNFVPPKDSKVAVLNLQNGKLVEQKGNPTTNDLFTLETDLDSFASLWHRI
ncbi:MULTISPECIES: hypothetical protein [Leuconostoc]|uniref:hypothetical protein n=1 Tax=Leuconostoc TaxID=1243 RepID=UPI0021A4BA94|nr:MULTISPECIES: hypothetical protein [Leuconostoc]MCT4388979.1 hypothetical protein [Leuconostoc falkenbergense]NLT85650.1 hypothetical protein [Leuconostoc sp.]